MCQRPIFGSIREGDSCCIFSASGEIVGHVWKHTPDGKLWIDMRCKARAMKRIAPRYVTLGEDD